MGSQTTSTIANLVKRVYDNYVESMQNLEARSIDLIGKSLKQYSPGGAGFYGAINDYGNESGGAINEGEQFRTVGAENYAQWSVKPKVEVWPIEFTGLSAAVAVKDEEAFANSVVDALDMARNRLLSDENRQFFGIGTGNLALAAQSHTAAVISMTVDTTQYLRKGQVLDIFNAATKTVDSRALSYVDHANKIISFGTSLGVAIVTTDFIVKENVRDSAPSDGKEMMGLAGIIDDSSDLTTFQGVDAENNYEWRSTVIDASSANLTSDLLQRLIDDVAILGGKEPDLLIMHAKQRRKYLDIVVPQKRYQDGKMDAGFSSLSFNGKELFLDKDCPADVIFAVDKTKLRKFELEPLKMGSHDGSDEFLRTTNYDKFQAYWRHYCNFGTSKRNSHGKIESLAKGSGLS